jgi:hypothetical protein
MSGNPVKMKRTRINVKHLDQHFSFPVFARSSWGCGIGSWWRRGNLRQILLLVCGALECCAMIFIGKEFESV